MNPKGPRKNKPAPGKPLGAGHSSFDRIDIARLFIDLGLGRGRSFLDIACGRGPYVLAAAEVVGPEGRLYAVDLWKEGISALKREARARGLKNVAAEVADAGRAIPFPDASADAALLAIVLHDLVEEGKEAKALRETARVLKPGGRLAVVEFKKVESDTGPPKQVRLDPPAVQDMVAAFGFRKLRFRDLGPDLYCLIFGHGPEAEGRRSRQGRQGTRT